MHEFIEEIKIIKPKKLFFVDNPIDLCKLSYPGHKHGCPNIVKNMKIVKNKGNDEFVIKPCKNCPPFATKLNIKYDLLKSYFLCYVKFNLKKQKEKMKLLHSEWSDKKCKCLLYWQKSAVKELKKESSDFILKKYYKTIKDIYDYDLIPEAMGLNVFKTMEYYGIKLERNPENYVYKISFIGVLK